MRPTRYRLRQPRPLCCQNRHAQKAIAAGLEPATVGSEVQRSSIEPRDQLLAEHIKAALAQLGERQTEDLKVLTSILRNAIFLVSGCAGVWVPIRAALLN